MLIYKVPTMTPVAHYENLAGAKVEVVDCAAVPDGHEPGREIPAHFDKGFNTLRARNTAYCTGCGATAGDFDELDADPYGYKYVPLATTEDGPQRVIFMGSDDAAAWARAHAANCSTPAPAEITA